MYDYKLKIKKINISADLKSRLATIGNYWIKEAINKISELFIKY